MFRSSALLALLALLPLAAPSLVQAQPASSLPAGRGLDPRKVVESRYGKEARDDSGAFIGAAAKEKQDKQDKQENGEQEKPEDKKQARKRPAANPDAPPAPAPFALPRAFKRIEGSLATVAIDNTGGAQAGEPVPVTFGQVFAPGAVPRGQGLAGKTADGKPVALQVDAKARHPDGSLRHAVISALLPRPAAGAPLRIGLWPAERAAAAAPAAAGAELEVPEVSVIALIDGKRYTASTDGARAAPGARWLAGPVASESQLAVPLRGPAGQAHPHLVARFALRSYPGAKRTRIDVTVENSWAYEPDPRTFTYDAEIVIGKESVWRHAALPHYRMARWRKLFWAGGDPGVEVRHDGAALIASRAVPNYDPALQISEKALSRLADRWQGPVTEPMSTGLAENRMATTGGRSDIGLLPGWTATYVVSTDPRARRAMLGTADLAGSFSAHYRDKRTGLPISLLDYPYMTTLGQREHARNPATGKNEGFPPCVPREACASPHRHDVAHQPSLAYVPYLVTGDYYYLEELQFWAMFNAFSSNPHYRQGAKGLLKPYQVRGQAWALRTLAHAAYITPDAHPLKSHFLRILDSNLDWYHTRYVTNAQANRLGFVEENYAIVYLGKTGLAPWQDDFFTSAVGHVVELGFDKARPLLAWKANFPVQRMGGSGTCWIAASQYSLKVRDTPASAFYTSIEQVYRASSKPEVLGAACASPEMAAALKLAPGEMPGYSKSSAGFPSNLQPALAYAAGAAGKAGREAWERFMARPVQPDYSGSPQFAIVPR